MLIDSKKLKKRAGVTQEQMSRMEREMSNVQGQYKQQFSSNKKTGQITGQNSIDQHRTH
ncbi:MAG: hypothetical protein Q7J38_06710 [Gallionella sp.]|nr:hypothetical protein [Gallionella sp.]